MRVTFYTLGCKVNQNETGALAQLFEENGYTVVPMKKVRMSISSTAAPSRISVIRKAVSGCAAPSARTPAR